MGAPIGGVKNMPEAGCLQVRRAGRGKSNWPPIGGGGRAATVDCRRGPLRCTIQKRLLRNRCDFDQVSRLCATDVERDIVTGLGTACRKNAVAFFVMPAVHNDQRFVKKSPLISIFDPRHAAGSSLDTTACMRSDLLIVPNRGTIMHLSANF